MSNQFLSLTTQYGKYRKMMSETGQGLINKGREDEITPGSEIANIWGRYHMFIYLFLMSNLYCRVNSKEVLMV